MRRSFVIVIAIGVLVSACQTSQRVSQGPTPAASMTSGAALMQVPPERAGQVLVTIGAGPARNKGEHWFPAGTTLATVLDWAGLDPVFPPRGVYLVDPEGHRVRYRLEGVSRKKLERVKISHGTLVIVPWD